jgi:hypothetical protein
MQIKFMSVIVDDQDKALKFYTIVLFEDTCGNLINLVQPV